VVAGEVVSCDIEWQGHDASIAGRVTTANGTPLPYGASVQVLDVEGVHMAGVVVGATGAYRIELPSGSVYSVVALAGPVQRRRDGVRPNATGVDFVVPEAVGLRLRLVDAATQRSPSFRDVGGIEVSWRESGAAQFLSTHGEVDSTGLIRCPVAAGRIDLALDLQQHGYRPWRGFGIEVPRPDPTDEVRVELARGVELRLAVVGMSAFTPAMRSGHALFVLGDSQLSSVRGPFPEPGRSGIMRIDGLGMWLAEPGLRTQMPRFDAAGRATVTGLVPGRYRLVSFPDDLVFEPTAFAVGDNGADVELRWRRR
jgi:hypothetical protein